MKLDKLDSEDDIKASHGTVRIISAFTSFGSLDFPARRSSTAWSRNWARNRKKCDTEVIAQLIAAIKSKEDIVALRSAFKCRRKGREVAAYYEKQNALIEELLKPIEELDNEEEAKNLVKLQIAMYGSLVANILLLGLQMFAAITSGSLALFSTMADSFMDLASNIVLVIASVSASKRNNQRYPTGKQRFETAGIVVFSCIMGALAVQLIIEGGTALAGGERTTNLDAVNLSCIGVAVAVKACLLVYCSMLSKYPSARVLAQDHRNDVALNLTGIVLSVLGHNVKWWVDPLGGILIASYILINWGETAMEHIQMFIGKSASRGFLARLTFVAMTHDHEILQVDTVRAYSSGAGYFVEVDIVMDINTPLYKSHDIGEALQTKLELMDEKENSYFLPHLPSGWHVDQAILSEEDRVVIIRFGHDWDSQCMKMDEVLYSIAEKVKNFAVIYLVDISEVPDFNKMYELYDPCTVMFFYRNKHIMIDLGTGNNNKVNWALEDKQEMIDIVEVVFQGARKGRGLVISPKDYSTKYKY
ncbi:hypothetical protein CcCBS67573_g07951 [Chytriomyces confervae]|uniref:Cation efflux protein transmembrane domain-containing protein n=1 Tax=Chytriomyces confervae TaxID=246404 RepID=A0A507EQH8_9FUNG|nr:hypothetical protein CcCBS67573_g07951 [Chytriomyces confervae]